MDGDGCHFWIIFYGEFISIIKNAIGCKKCARTHALLGACAHFNSQIHFMVGEGCNFWILCSEETILIVNNYNRLQKLHAHAYTFKVYL